MKDKLSKSNRRILCSSKLLSNKLLYSITSFVLITTLLYGLSLGLGLSSSSVSASGTNSEQSNVSVTVPNSCTLTGQVTSAHTATIVNGTLRNDIGTTKMKIYCNDSGGYTVYAIGASNDEDTNTNLVSGNGSPSIATGLATSGATSAWAMKLTVGSGTGTSPTQPTIATGYDDYHVVPNTYTAVANRQSSTDMNPDVDVTGSYFTTTYRVYVSGTQPAATYTGKVKYAVLHPYTDDDLVSLENALADAHAPTKTVGDKTYYTMQGLTSGICDNVTITGVGSATKLVDTRDDNLYYVTKLPDGKCWMLDNLRLDPTDSTTANNMSESNTNAPAAAISNYLNPTGTAPQTGWSTAAVADVDTGFNSYTDPMINNASEDTLVPSYGAASTNGKAKVGIYYNYCAATAGTYCYAGSSSFGDASYDICPANWRMPSGGASGEYQSLCNAVYGGECTNPTSMTGTSLNSLQYNLSTPLSGYYNGSQVNGRNGYGGFWSSTRSNNNSNMYYLGVYSSSVYPQYDSNRNIVCYDGFSVRCVAGS